MNRERVVLVVFSLLVAAALVLLGTSSDDVRELASSKPAVSDPDSSKDCYFIRYMPVRFRADSPPYGVEWDLCVSDSDFPENHITVESRPGEKDYSFEPADIVQQMERKDFDKDGNEELLVVGQEGGTGVGINWCVLGWIAHGLDCWSAPGSESELEPSAKKLLKDDEDFCCKDWTLKVVNNNILLGRGIYHSGLDGNCCPSRGGVMVELKPKHGQFQFTRQWRISKQEYENWKFSP